MENSPLVSIVVITYNSSKYVLETLQSAYSQTYQNIELIVSDDCSKDNTVEIIEKWLKENGSRFVKFKLLRALENTGVTANCNRGVKEAHGEWIKLIAGDDILFDDCIESNYMYVCESHAQIVFSKMKFFCDSKDNSYVPSVDYGFFDFPCKKQLKLMLRENEIRCTPSSFIKKDLLNKVSYYDERFPMIEDYPMWFKLLAKGCYLSFMDKYTVYYRKENSITHSEDRYVHPLYLESLEKFYKSELFPRYGLLDYGYMIHKKMDFLLGHICVRYFANRVTLLYRIIFLMFRCLDVYWYIDLWERKMNK